MTEKQRVLVIEDDVDCRVALQLALEVCGFVTEPAGQADEAVHRLREHRYIAVVSDLAMPGNGHSVLEYVRQLQPGTPVIVVTSERGSRERDRAREMGAVAILDKPIDLSQLLSVLTGVNTPRQSKVSH